MKPFRVVRSISPELIPIIDDVLPLREPWYVRSPRGGYHRAIPPFKRRVVVDPEPGMPGVWVVDRCAGTRYLRPGTREHAIAREVAS